MKIKFLLEKKNLRPKDLNRLIKIIKSENSKSILSSLSKKNINRYLSIIINSRNLKLFLIKIKEIEGYAIIANKPHFLINEFGKMEYQIFFDLLGKMKFKTLINLTASKLKIDTFIKSRTNKKNFYDSVNLNLLAISRKLQSRGIGKKFLTYVIKNNGYKSRFISCETDNLRSKNFYMNKLKFKQIGKRIRIPKLMDILIKKI